MRLVYVILVALVLTSVVQAQQYTPPHSQPGPATDTIRIRAYAEENAPAVLEKGDMDIYLYNMRISRILQLENKPGIRLIQAPSLTLSLILNPAPAPPDELNPFSIREVRWAMQYLVDRDFISREIYLGHAAPMVTHVSPYDYDYTVVFTTIREAGIRYDPDLAGRIITEAMTKAGAEKKDGVWTFKGQPITVKFIIRTEDERREIGELVATRLSEIGFRVERIYHPFAQAISKVYTTDPQEFQWHIYTEGWGRGAVEKYDFASINQFCAPWLGNMPGWLEVGYWQYTNPKLDELGQRIFRGDFISKEVRDSLYREALKTCMDESIRIWVAVVFASNPVSDKMVGVTEDLGAGVRGLWTLREAYIPGKDVLNVGHLWVWTPRTIWNPVAGFNDVYSADIWRAVYDPPIARHPFTGLPIPFRASYQVETAGPEGRLQVPSDAFMWDPISKEWKKVQPGTTAISKVVFDYSAYTGSKWHHGIRISMADILYKIYQIYDLAYDDVKSKIEFALAATSRPVLETFKGFRIVGDSTLEVYVDFWHFEHSYISEYAEIFGGGMPWEILAAGDHLVFEARRLAYSDTASARFGVPQLNLVLSSHVADMRDALNTFLVSKFFPKNVFTVGGRTYETVDNAIERYRAALEWASKYGILVISSGPYQLTAFDPGAQFAELRAYRDPTYPFKPGEWYFGTTVIPRVEAVEGELKVGQDSTITFRLSGGGQITVAYYLIESATQTVVMKGVVDARNGRADARIPSDMVKTGLYELAVLAYSDQVSLVTTRVERLRAAPPTTATKTTTTPTITTETTVIAEQQQPSTTLIVIVAAVAAVAVAAFIILRRRR
jgi:peptide/nickel transport system substrate-binding protein